MSKILRFVCVFGICTVLFCFGGCTWFGSGGGIGEGGGTGGGSGLEDDRIQQGIGTDKPNTPFEGGDIREEYIDVTDRARVVYKPNATDVSAEADIQAERDLFNKNTIEQYTILSTYILNQLVGKYGSSTGEQAKQTTYVFFADRSLLPSGERYELVVDIPKLDRVINNQIRLDSTDGAIEGATSGLDGTYENGVWTVWRTYFQNSAWICSLGKDVESVNYNREFLDKYVPYLTLNMMRYVLGMPELSSTEYNDLINRGGTEFITEELNACRDKIDILGVDNSGDKLKNYLHNFILYNIIGEENINREFKSITYYEPSAVVEREDGTTETVYYDMNQNPLETTIITTEWYNYDYEKTVTQILNSLFSTESFINDYPTHSRVEFTDISAEKYCKENIVVSETIEKLDNMPYNNYESVVIYPSGSFDYDEAGNSVFYETPKLWQFDMLQLSVDSINEITLNLYMRIHYQGQNYIFHLARMNTDPSLTVDEEPPAAEKTEENTDENDSGFNIEDNFVETKSNVRVVATPLYLDETLNDLLSNGLEKTNEKEFFNGENEYKSVFAGKLGSKVTLERQNLIVTNHFGQQIDLSDKFLCNDNADFVEFIFDVEKNHGENYDYSFKFGLYGMFWGEFILEEEQI